MRLANTAVGNAHQPLPPITVPSFTENGRRLHRFSQSVLKTLDLCLERGRLELSGLMPRGHTDATALGEAVHEAIELCVREMIDGQGPMALSDMIAVAWDYFDVLTTEPSFTWVKDKTAPTVHAKIQRCLMSFYREVLPSLCPSETELAWGPLVIYEDDERIIELTGTIDYIDGLTGPADWKTTGRKWEPWEHQRWDVQPTTYTWALRKLGWEFLEGAFPFTWHVFNVDGSYQYIQTDRHEGDWAWLAHRCESIARLIEADLVSWPLNDSSALCSPKFCGAWDQCKGKHYAEGWPKPSAPNPTDVVSTENR